MSTLAMAVVLVILVALILCSLIIVVLEAVWTPPPREGIIDLGRVKPLPRRRRR